MRSFFRDHWKAIVVLILLVVLAMFTVDPGAATPAPSSAPSLAARLRTHVAAVAPAADDGAGPQQLRRAARYIEATLESEGYAVRRPAAGPGAQAVRDLEVSIANLAPHAKPERIFIVGAHVRAPGGGTEPDAARAENLRGSGTAAVLELARLLRKARPGVGTEIRFVFFFENPMREHMRGQDFIAFVGTLESSRQVQQALAAFQGSAGVPTRGLAAPAYVQGVTLSGQSAYRGPGAPAVMVTDTAFGRFPYYEATGEAANAPAADPTPDAPGQPDYTGMARVVSGLARTIEALAAAQQG